MNYSKIDELARKKKISIRKLIELMGVSVAGYYKMIDNETLTVENLEKISKILDVRPDYFFDDSVYNSELEFSDIGESKDNTQFKVDINEVKKLREINSSLKEENSKLKDKIIELLERSK